MNEIEEREEFSWLGIGVAALPILVVVAHLLWPHLAFLKYAAAVVVLLVATFLLSALSAQLTGHSEFYLHFGWMVLVLLIGIPLFVFYGWISTAWIIGGYFFAVTRYFILFRILRNRGDIEEGVAFLPAIDLFDMVILVGFILLSGWMFQRHGPLSTVWVFGFCAVIALTVLAVTGEGNDR
jgi:hypothetical protein